MYKIMNVNKFDTTAARVIAAQLYVAKRLHAQPAKMIKFIKTNRDYFAGLSEKMLSEMQKEHNLTDEDIDKEPEVTLADIKSEAKYETELMAKAEKIDELRRASAGTDKGEYVGRSKEPEESEKST